MPILAAASSDATDQLPIRHWRIAPALSSAEYAPYRGLNRVLATILYQRGIRDHLSALRFLNGETTLNNPFQMRGVPEAVNRIRRAIKAGELIAVYGDFDADGVTSTALLVLALKALGARVGHYIPDRVDEGYGLNTGALDRLRKAGARLVITVDCGIRSVAEVEYGTRVCGLDMIVTDHHSVGPDLPAGIVINPKQPGCKYGEDMLAGVGVTYRLADALFRAAAANSRDQRPAFPIESLLDLAAIGTIADLMPLDHAENRVLAIAGLNQIRTAPRPGIKALLDVAATSLEDVGAQTIGFRIAPRLNAAGRLKSAEIAYKLLTATTYEAAYPIAQELQTLNTERQALTREAQDFAVQLIGDPNQVPLIFASSPDFPQGIVGLVAGRLVEEYHRPAVIVQRGPEESHGSCRSPEAFHITAALDECAELLTRHGGHAQAAGFSLPTANLPAFQAQLTDIADRQLRDADLTPWQQIDAEVRLADLTLDLVAELARLEPTGHGNLSPVLGTRRLRVLEKKAIGNGGDHLRLRLADNDFQINGVYFRNGRLVNAIPEWVDVAYQVQINEWQGSRKLELMIQDIQPA